MAVAVSWGVFLGASIVGHVAEDINADDVTPEENEADTEAVEENHENDASNIGVIEPIENNSDVQKSEDDVEEVAPQAELRKRKKGQSAKDEKEEEAK